ASCSCSSSSTVTSRPTRVSQTKSTPSRVRWRSFWVRISRASLKLGMPCASVPPGSCHCSTTVTPWPRRASSSATVRPEGPEAAPGPPPAAGLDEVHGQGEAADAGALLVGDERLQLADAHGWLGAAVRADGEADGAVALAQPLLRTEPATHLGQVAGAAKD